LVDQAIGQRTKKTDYDLACWQKELSELVLVSREVVKILSSLLSKRLTPEPHPYMLACHQYLHGLKAHQRPTDPDEEYLSLSSVVFAELGVHSPNQALQVPRIFEVP